MILDNRASEKIYSLNFKDVKFKYETNIADWIGESHPRNTQYFFNNSKTTIIALINHSAYEVFMRIDAGRKKSNGSGSALYHRAAFRTNSVQSPNIRAEDLERVNPETHLIVDSKGEARFITTDPLGGSRLISDPVLQWLPAVFLDKNFMIQLGKARPENINISPGEYVILTRDVETGQTRFHKNDKVEVYRIDDVHGFCYRKGDKVINHCGWNSCKKINNCN